MTLGTVQVRRGRVHVARLEHGEWLAACWRSFSVRRADLSCEYGRDAAAALRAAVQDGKVCLDCYGLLGRGREAFSRVTGW